jgi:hypothetical protein
MGAALRWVRKSTRFCVALLLWLNGLLLLRVSIPSVSPLAIRLHLNTGETTILLLLAGFSILFSYGWKNITVDLLYLYFFPFVFLYLVIRSGFWLLSCAFKAFRPTEIAEISTPVLEISGQTKKAPEPEGAASSIRKNRFSWWLFLKHWLRPFLQFTILWCLLLLLTSHWWLLATALVIVLVHLGRTLVMVVGFAVFSVKGLSQLDARIRAHVERLISQVLSEQSIATEDLRKTWAWITALQLGTTLLRNRQRAAQFLVFLAVLIFVATYFYLAFLFAFGYYGLARVQSIPYSWKEALVTAIFIPAAFGDLPHNIWIKLLGGIHWSFVVLVGAGTIFGYLQRKLNSVYRAADFLSSRLQEEEVKKRIAILNDRFKVAVAPATPKPAE